MTRSPGGLRVLLAEDNPVNQEVARTALERRGHRVTLVEDGAAAVAAVGDADYDIVVMDLQMPGMDGIDACQHIRALVGPRAGVPILAVTANASAAVARECLAAGMNAHMTKPYRPDELVRMVEGTAVPRSLMEEPAEANGVAGDGSDPLLDEGVILTLARDLGVEMARSLIAMHIRHADGLEPRIQAAIASADAAPVARAFHQLKSASGTVGFARAARLAAEAETCAEAGAIAALADRYRAFSRAMEESEMESRRLL